jgi:bifunctional UDP-N-acetylglucosamine pyrophosphorylase/glucosamine-1-phosphate N-acetyltransferase
MQCVILAAGRGVRMGSLTDDVPKPMLPILGKPMLEWKLEMLPQEIDEVIITVGYLGDRISSYFGDIWNGHPMRYVRQEVLDGSGGSIRLVHEAVPLSFPVLVTMGDDFYHQDDLADLMKVSPAVLGLGVDHAEQFGLLAETPEGMLKQITERPHGEKTGIVNTGAYILPSEYFDYKAVKITDTEYGLPQTLAEMAKDIPVKVLRARAWQPVGCPEDLPKGEAFLKKYWL